MRLTVKNLGPISEASVDLSKDLIILAGENNTGKTYLAYVSYGVFSPYWIDDKNVIQWASAIEKPELSSQAEIWEFNILDKFKEIVSYSLEKTMPMRFATDARLFKDTKVHLSVEGSEQLIKTLEGLEVFEHNSNYSENSETGYEATIEKKKGSLEVKITTKSLSENGIIFPKNGIEVSFLAQHFRKILQLRPSIIFPAERTGITLFHKELTVIKNKVFDSLLANGKAQEMIGFIGKRFNKYPTPIKDAIEFSQNLDAYQKQKSEFIYLSEVLNNEFLNGNITLTEDGDIRFIPKASKKVLEAHMTSSTVKSLASLSFYLSHTAQKGDFIIIDEPEANLHPNNQIKIARFLARLVNEGFKVMISTHSDYIMRELNSLIMLGTGERKSPKAAKELLTKFPEYNDKQFLDNKQVGVYLFRQGKPVEELEIREDGFEIATIDETVDRLNETSQNIYYELFA